MITVLNKSKASQQGTSSYNLNLLDNTLARQNFINSVSAVTTPVHTLTNFNTFMDFIYTRNLQSNLSLWFSAQYTERSGSIVGNLQDVDKIFLYSKNKDYSGQYLQSPSLMTKAKFDSTDNSIRFTTAESLYYNLEIDKVLPLGNTNKTIAIVMSPLNSTYEYDNTENNWFFNYGLEWTSSLQPSSEGLCYTYDSLVTGGKKFSYTVGGNNNIIITYDAITIARKGLLIISYNNSSKSLNSYFQGNDGETIYFNEVVSGSPKTDFTLPVTPSGIGALSVYVNGSLKSTSDYSLVGNTLTMNTAVQVGEQLSVYIYVSSGVYDVNYPVDIKSGNGFFLNSHILNNSVNLTTQAFHRMKNWKFYEFMVFDKVLDPTLKSNLYAYLKSKYSLVDLNA